MSMETLIEVRNKLLLFLPNYWTPVVVDNSGVSVLLLSRQTQITVQRSVVFKSSGEVVVNVHCKEVNSETFLEQSSPPMPLIDSDSESQNYFVDRAVRIVSKVRPMEICAGADIENYTPVWESCEKGVIDNNPYKECRYFETFRSHQCSLLVQSNKWRCPNCSAVIRTLRKKHQSLLDANKKAGNKSSKTANIHLTKEEMLEKLKDQRKCINNQNQTIRRLRQRMKELIDKESKKIDDKISEDLTNIIRDSKMTPAQSIFFQQQVKYSQLNNKSSMKWHPAILRFALSVFEASRSAYERMRDSGFLALPTSRTLFDYTHFAAVKEGIDEVVLDSLANRMETLPEKQRYHVLMADEMYISKNLVYKKNSGELIGYTNLNDVDKELRELDQYFNDPNKELKKDIASKVLVFLVKGVATDVKEAVCSYPVTSFSPIQLHSWTWHLIGALKRRNILIIAFTCDGCPINRAFIKTHEPSHTPRKSGVVYATINIHAPHRQLFFISDVPHLLKTLRNSLCSSRLGKKGKRCMEKNGEKLVWDHIIRLYNEKKKKVLRKSYKLAAQHVYPDSYTCMKVAPAAQVLSATVSTDLRNQNWPGTFETSNFLMLANNWFDDNNGAHSSVGLKTNNKRLCPYTEPDDWRFKETEDFVNYLVEWQEEAKNSAADASAVNVSDVASLSMCEDGEVPPAFNNDELVEDRDDDGEEETKASKKVPAAPTILGVEMATLAIKEAIQFLLKKKLNFINPRVFCQDPLEQYFSKQRDGCGGSTNPNLHKFLHKGRTIHVTRQIGIKSRRGNTEMEADSVDLSEEPLKKRRRGNVDIFDI